MVGAFTERTSLRVAGSVASLDLWLMGSRALAEATQDLCRITSPEEGADLPRLLGERRPDLLLVEGTEALPPGWSEELGGLLQACEESGVPRFLWVTASRLDPVLARLCPRFSRVFSTDRDHLPRLREAGAQSPALLWPGTALPIESPDGEGVGAGEERPDPVVWVGGWDAGWPEGWRERLLSILEGAAAHGLKIADPGESARLPERLRRLIDSSPAPAALRRAKIAIATDPAGVSPRFAPTAAFDAMACGAAVVTPHAFASIFDFSQGKLDHSSWEELISVATDGETATAAIDGLLSDGERLNRTATLCKRIVELNHTHAHRLATLASAAGIRVLPDAAASPAHS